MIFRTTGGRWGEDDESAALSTTTQNKQPELPTRGFVTGASGWIGDRRLPHTTTKEA
jgi:hypothetical protein